MSLRGRFAALPNDDEIATPPKITPALAGGARESGGSQRHYLY
jgi:hypothetical protein